MQTHKKANKIAILILGAMSSSEHAENEGGTEAFYQVWSRIEILVKISK